MLGPAARERRPQKFTADARLAHHRPAGEAGSGGAKKSPGRERRTHLTVLSCAVPVIDCVEPNGRR
jgi:hypothetical protein